MQMRRDFQLAVSEMPPSHLKDKLRFQPFVDQEFLFPAEAVATIIEEARKVLQDRALRRSSR